MLQNVCLKNILLRYLSLGARYGNTRSFCRSNARDRGRHDLQTLSGLPRVTSCGSTVRSFSYDNDTIYALSTAPGRAAIAIIRISGPSCLEIYSALCPGKPIPKPRYATLRTLYDQSADRSDILDSDALVLHFPAPKTATGEDVLELHVHGGPATVKAILAAIPRCSSQTLIRYAEPGEFTKRAFQSSRLDLAQVESLSDTLSAETEQQRRAAVRGNSGKLGRAYEAWRQQLLSARGELEALIDFSEDQHFDESPKELLSNVTSQVDKILESIIKHEKAGHRAELLKRGIRISLLGPPNVGKSSLLNQMVGREAAIVSSEAGTTRDIVEVSLDLKGYLCAFADTAGLRIRAHDQASHPISRVEQEGIRRAKAKASESDIVVVLGSVEFNKASSSWMIHYDPESIAIAAKSGNPMIVINKVDCVTLETLSTLLQGLKTKLDLASLSSVPMLTISCKHASDESSKESGNLHELVKELVGMFENMTALPTDLEDLLGVTERQGQLLMSCSQHLLDFKEEAHASEGRGYDIVISAEHLRSAANCLSRITGRGESGDIEEVLGVIFEKFCVGK